MSRALVTGSSSGIGLAIARRLSATHGHVHLHGFKDSDDAIAKALEACGGKGRASYTAADLSRPEEARALAKEAGNVGTLVNCAGFQHVAPVAEFPEATWDALIAVHLSAPFHLCKALSPAMVRAGHGRIVNVASVHGLVASLGKAPYVAAKHGLVGFTKVLALELARTGVTANCVAPGFVKTPLVMEQLKARGGSEEALLEGKQPTGKMIDADEVARMVAYLCEEESASTTGACYTVDGGWTAQ